MQPGLFLLWSLTVFGAAAAWFYLQISMKTRENFRSRRGITGCELARQVLDRYQFSQAAVYPCAGNRRVHFGFEFDRLILSDKTYYGTRLADLGAALHEAAHLMTDSRMVLGTRFVRPVLLLSWVLVFAGFLLPPARGVLFLGEFLFLVLGLRAVVRLAGEWEVTQRALACLASIEGFGTDERVRIKDFLKVLRWSPLAEIFAAL